MKQTHQGRLSGMEAIIFNHYNCVHNVVGFHLRPTSIVVDVQSYDGVHASQVTFRDSSLLTMDPHEDLDLPWSILGIHETARDDGRWRIVFATTSVEFVFEAAWPQVIPQH
jgi:hypothetical protein